MVADDEKKAEGVRHIFHRECQDSLSSSNSGHYQNQH